MKKRFIAGLLVFVLGLTGCGRYKAAETIAAPANTTAATFEISTATEYITSVIKETITTTTVPATIAPPIETTAETTAFDKELWEVDFPIEFSSDWFAQPPWLGIPKRAYDIKISPKAQKLYDELDSLANKVLLSEYPSFELDGKTVTPGYNKADSGFQIYPGRHAAFGLIDIDNNGTPEAFGFQTDGSQGYAGVNFYDLQSDTPTEPLFMKVGGFCRDGVTYFGRLSDGKAVMCSGYMHSNWMGDIKFDELTYTPGTPNEEGYSLTAERYFRTSFSLSNNTLVCDAVEYEGERLGLVWGAWDATAEEFETIYREAYNTIDFDVYWICGDILYHGAEETEYKGTMAYEKYLEFTAKKTAVSRSPLLKPYDLDINVMSEKEKDNLDFTNIRNELSALDDDTLTKIEKAYIIARGISFCNIVYTGNFNSNSDEDSGVYYYGISYESYFDYLKTVFTEDMIDKLFTDYKLFVDIDGELCKVGIGDRGSDPLYDYGVYSIISTDSEKIEITLTAYRSDGDIVYQPSSYDIVLVKVDGEWKVNEFEYWC
jgi:hypothetical protein